MIEFLKQRDVTEKYAVKYNEITRTLLQELINEEGSDNIVISPLSVIILLGIAADAVDGAARDEIVKLIGNGMTYDVLMMSLKNLQISSCENSSLMLSNAVCIKHILRKSISAGYEAHLEEIFDGKLFSSDNLVRDVNAWVRRKTNGMIHDVINQSAKDMMACLMNAAAFESEWLEQYERDDIYDGEFKNADGTVSEVQMLKKMEDLYIEDKFFTGFIKPYQDRNYAFMALLPKNENDAAFLGRAISRINFTRLFEGAAAKRVYAAMPEFDYDYDRDLNTICQKLGIRTLFTPDADFSPMSDEWLMVDSIIHKAHIEVDRNGTRAAAVTMAEIYDGCIPDMNFKIVELDRPFIYAIMNTQMHIPVFAGIYNHAN